MAQPSSTICIDSTLAAEFGLRNAVVFEKVWWLIHKSEKSTAALLDSKWWSEFSYERLHGFFKAKSGKNYLGSVRTLRRAVDELVAANLLYRKQTGDGVRLAINFDGLNTLIGDVRRYLCVPPNMPTENITEGESVQMWTVTVTQGDSPEMDIQDVQIGTDGLTESGQSDSPQVDTPYIYDSESLNESFDEEKTLPPADADGAKIAPANEPEKMTEEVILEKPSSKMIAVTRVAFSGAVVTEEIKKQALSAIGRIENTQVYMGNERVKPLLDVETIEDYALWRMLLNETGESGFPNLEDFVNELRFTFLKWYRLDGNRSKLTQIKQQFPGWRTMLFAGDYQAFRAKVQSQNSQVKPAQSTKPKKAPQAWQNLPYGETPTTETIEWVQEVKARRLKKNDSESTN